jgi:hypothetical protein
MATVTNECGFVSFRNNTNSNYGNEPFFASSAVFGFRGDSMWRE